MSPSLASIKIEMFRLDIFYHEVPLSIPRVLISAELIFRKRERGERMGRPKKSITERREMGKVGVEASQIRSWKRSLATVGLAVCIQPQCRLSFLTIQGIIRHYQSCPGTPGSGDVITCSDCAHRFSRYSIKSAHARKCLGNNNSRLRN